MKTLLPKTTVLLLGGGLTHAFLLSRLSPRDLDQLKIILITPFSRIYYLEMAGGYLEGFFSEPEITVDLAQLCQLKEVKYLETNPAKVDTCDKSVTLEDGQTINYDILSLNLESYGREAEGVFQYGQPIRYGANLKKVKQHFSMPNIDSNITIVGAGKLGIEIALTLRHLVNHYRQDVRVTLIDAAQSLLPGYDLKVKQIVQDELKNYRIELLLGRKVVRISGDLMFFNDNSILDYGYLIWTVKPKVYPFLEGAGLIRDQKGRLQVNSHLQTINPIIFGSGERITFQDWDYQIREFNPAKEAVVLLENIIRLRNGKNLSKYLPFVNHQLVINLGNKQAVMQKHELVLQGAQGWHSQKAKDEKLIKLLQNWSD